MIQEGSYVLVHVPEVIGIVHKIREGRFVIRIVSRSKVGTTYPGLYQEGRFLLRQVSEVTELLCTKDQVRALVHILDTP